MNFRTIVLSKKKKKRKGKMKEINIARMYESLVLKKSRDGYAFSHEGRSGGRGGASLHVASREHDRAMPSRYKVEGGVRRSMSISVPLLIKRRNLIEPYRVGRGVYM